MCCPSLSMRTILIFLSGRRFVRAQVAEQAYQRWECFVAFRVSLAAFITLASLAKIANGTRITRPIDIKMLFKSIYS